MNNARGHLVEFLVAKELGDDSERRVEWGPFDVRAADGTLVEIKTAGRMQSWAGKPSSYSWSFKSVRASSVWSDELGAYVPVEPWTGSMSRSSRCTRSPRRGPTTRSTCRSGPHRQLLSMEQVSASLSTFDRMGLVAVPLEGLAEVVRDARRANDSWTGPADCPCLEDRRATRPPGSAKPAERTGGTTPRAAPQAGHPRASPRTKPRCP
jgi:hypothetical protein